MIETRRSHWPALVPLALYLGVACAGDGAAADVDAIGVDGATVGRLGEPVAVDEKEFKFSEAETQLWLADHLKNITQPMRLKYEFIKSGSYEEGFSDVVTLDIRKVNDDGTKNADMQFFSGERAQPFTPDSVTEIRGNPVLGLYLRGDVYDMNRLTEGSWRYFQRRIKLALSEAALVEPVEIDFLGRKVKARKIVITPYLKDPHSAQFEQFTVKRYEFTLSDAVPGTIYQIRTVVPGPGQGDAPLLEERLTLTRVDSGTVAGAGRQ
ncbi:MAG: hypothetical protein HYR49_11170 [Gammaproteobacteria bacterium]|nr:hypothetical protein [Gammaproteobacteria bacterium]